MVKAENYIRFSQVTEGFWGVSLHIEETVKWYLDNQKWMEHVTSGEYQKCRFLKSSRPSLPLKKAPSFSLSLSSLRDERM